MATNINSMTMFINADRPHAIVAKQFDAASRFLEVTLVDDSGLPINLTGHRVQFNARKADGTLIKNNAVIVNAAAGRFRVELTDQTLAIGDSRVEADITVFTNDAREILTTRTFYIDVQATVRDDAAVESSSEFNAVVTLFQDVWDMRETIRSINDRFGHQGDAVGTGEQVAGASAFAALNRIWNYLRTQSTAAVVEMVGSLITMSNTLLDRTTERATGFARVHLITTSGTYTVPPNVRTIRLSMIGAGGDGQASMPAAQSRGAGCGDYIIERAIAVTPGQTFSCTVGSGNTIFGSFVCLKGTTDNHRIPLPQATLAAGSAGQRGLGSTTHPGAPPGAAGAQHQNLPPGATAGSPGLPGGGAPWKFSMVLHASAYNPAICAGGDGGMGGVVHSGVVTHHPTPGQPGSHHGAGGGSAGTPVGTGANLAVGGLGAPGLIVIEY